MDVKNKIYFAIILMLFYFGNLITTYIGLQNGGYEGNTLLAFIGFYGIIIVKTFYMIMVLYFISYLEKKNEFAQEIGVMIGAIMAFGLFTVFNNIGLYS
ncbi:MAG: DUF5658 family protein [Methanosarcinales archaeon]|nr:DUF5658 family protein [Methanosarcinales archaeon]